MHWMNEWMKWIDMNTYQNHTHTNRKLTNNSVFKHHYNGQQSGRNLLKLHCTMAMNKYWFNEKECERRKKRIENNYTVMNSNEVENDILYLCSRFCFPFCFSFPFFFSFILYDVRASCKLHSNGFCLLVIDLMTWPTLRRNRKWYRKTLYNAIK